MKALKKMYLWMGSHAHKPYAYSLLAFFFYLEAIFFIPTDPMLALYCMERRDKALSFAWVATLASVAGGITSYLIGYFLWKTAGQAMITNFPINWIMNPETFERISVLFRTHGWIAILIAGFTPIPYKAATLAAGFCSLAFIPFVICSMIARGARFFIVAFGMKAFGHYAKNLLDNHFTAITVTAAIVLILSVRLFT